MSSKNGKLKQTAHKFLKYITDQEEVINDLAELLEATYQVGWEDGHEKGREEGFDDGIITQSEIDSCGG